MKIPRHVAPDSWACIDCGVNTAPGVPIRQDLAAMISVIHATHNAEHDITYYCEMYMVKASVWRRAEMDDFDGCLCIGCLEQRIGRRLRPKDFVRNHPFACIPGTARLLSRRDGAS
jgi:hypothetical protein